MNRKYLVDSHILLWWFMEPKKLASSVYSVIEDPDNEIYISVATIWEIAIKSSLNKLKVPENFNGILEKEGFKVIPIDLSTAWKVKDLPFHHNDPFDRLIVATAMQQDLTVITHDEQFKGYGISVL